MRPFAKISALVAIILVALFVGLLILAKVVITPERVKATVLPLAEKQLQRKIELGDIRVSLFSGIELHDLVLYEADGREHFVTTDLVRLKYQLLPLLAMKVVVDEIRVETPRIRVVRKAGGRFNFDDLIGRPDQPSAQDSDHGESKGAMPISLLVSQVSIKDGKLVFLDYAIDAKAPHTSEISDLQVLASGITLTGSVPVSITCRINDARMEVDGSVSLAGPRGDFKVNVEDVDALVFKPYFQDAIPGKLDNLTLDLQANVAGGVENVSADGTLTLGKIDFTPDAFPEASLKKADIEIGYDLTVGLQTGTLEMRRSRVDFNGLVAEASGNVSSLFVTPVLALQLAIPGLDLKQALQALPAGMVAGAKELQPSGKVMLDAQLAGTLDNPLNLVRKATVSLDNVQVAANGQRPAVFGKLKLAGEKLVSDGLEMRLGENRARIDLTADNLLGKTKVVKADVSSEQFQFDLLLGAGGAAGAAADKGQGARTAKGEEVGPFDIPVQANGTIRIGKTVYQGLSIDDFIAIYTLQDNVLTISRMDGNIAGGSFANTARVDLGTKGLSYRAGLSVKSIQADPVLSAFFPKAAGALLGAMNLDLNVKGRGTQWETLNKQLSGQGDMLIADGRVVSPGLVNGFASFLQLSRMDEIRFSNFQGNVQIADGNLMIDSRIISDEVKLFPKGSIGLDGSLNLAMDTRLSPDVAGRLDKGGKVTRYLTDKDGWSQVPLLVSGNYASPRFGLDPKGLQKQATDALGKELGRHLDKLFGAPDPDKQQEGQEKTGKDTAPAEDPTNKLLQDSLKSLFGN